MFLNKIDQVDDLELIDLVELELVNCYRLMIILVIKYTYCKRSGLLALQACDKNVRKTYIIFV